MKLDKDIAITVLVGLALLVLLIGNAYQYEQHKSTFEVIEALRITDCTYKVGLEDDKGLYFVLELDLVSFSAMGVDVDDILAFGEL